MKKIITLLMVMVLTMVCASSVYADMGMPEKPQFTVVTGINGISYYEEYDYDDPDSAQPVGKLTGGQTFYVWADYSDQDFVWGTTDANATSDDYEDWVYIRVSDTVNSSSAVPPETGQYIDEAQCVETTGKLNVRCGPGTGFNKIKTLAKNTYLEYHYTFVTDSTWVYVTVDGISGWVSSSYLREAQKYTEPETQEEPQGTGQPQTEPAADQSGQSDISGNLMLIILISISAGVLAALLAVIILQKMRR